MPIVVMMMMMMTKTHYYHYCYYYDYPHYRQIALYIALLLLQCFLPLHKILFSLCFLRSERDLEKKGGKGRGRGGEEVFTYW